MAKIAQKIVKLQKKHHKVKKLDDLAEKIVEDVKAAQEADPWKDGPDVGRACRMVDEKVPSTFGAPAKVIGQMGTKLRLQVEGTWHSVVCEEIQVDWLPQLVPSGPKMALQLTNQAKFELCFRFPEMEGLQMNERLSGDHIQLGGWLVYREVGKVAGADLVPPLIVVNYCAGKIEKGEDAERCAEKCEKIILKRWRRSGLLGVPVWSPCSGPGSEHWTLLVLRRCSASDSQPLQYRYYDSAQDISPTNLSSADLIYQLICKDMKIEHQVIQRSNSALQLDGISCGVFVLHWWEGEVRRFHGEGWPLAYPVNGGCIKDRKKRLVGLVGQMLKFRDQQAKKDAEEDEAKKKKKKKLPEAAEIDPVEDRETSVNQAEIKMLELQKLAKDAADQGLVPFYGCSRCRFSRGGCISYNCNPHKFAKHLNQFPEKYEGKVLKILVDDKELVGGGGGKVNQVIKGGKNYLC